MCIVTIQLHPNSIEFGHGRFDEHTHTSYDNDLGLSIVFRIKDEKYNRIFLMNVLV